MSRARDLEFDAADGKVMIHFASAEDTLLHKLVWYQLGNRVSERQSHDVAGVIKFRADSLDRDYLEFRFDYSRPACRMHPLRPLTTTDETPNHDAVEIRSRNTNEHGLYRQ